MTIKDLYEKYCIEDTTNKEVWDGVSELDSASEIALLTNEELVSKYIDKYILWSASEIALLTNEELVSKYIDKYSLWSTSEIAFLTNEELVSKYIDKHSINDNLRTIIKKLYLKNKNDN